MDAGFWFGVASTLGGVVIGGGVSYVVGIRLQNRQFLENEKRRNRLLKSQLQTLAQGIEDDFHRLKELRNTVQVQSYPREYFEIRVKEALLIEFTKSFLFPLHKEAFDRVIRLLRKLSLLNDQIVLIQDIISDRAGNSISDKKYKWGSAIDGAVILIDEIIHSDIKELNNESELSDKLLTISDSFDS